MGLAQKSLAYIEPHEYLLMEEKSAEKHEYLDGVIYAWQGYSIRGMAGAPLEHNQVALNVAIALRKQTQGTDCRVFNSDTRLRPDDSSAYFYPDVSVRCGPALPGKSMEISDACVVVEVLSDTTEGFDRQDKFARYQRMAALQSYVLISPGRRSVEIYRRDQDWRPQPVATQANDRLVQLGTHDLSLQLSEVFEDL